MAGTSTLALAAGPALVASAVWIAGRVVGHSSHGPPRFVGWLAGRRRRRVKASRTTVVPYDAGVRIQLVPTR